MSLSDNRFVAIDRGFEIHHNDCLHGLRLLPNASVHAVITDPPYFIDGLDGVWNKRRVDEQKGKSAVVSNLPRGMAFDPQQGRKLQAFMEPVATELFRVLKSGGFCLSFSQARLYHRMGVAFEDAGFEIRDMCGWTYYGQPKAASQAHWVQKANIPASRKAAIIDSMKGRKSCQLAPMIEPIVLAQRPCEGTFWRNWEEHEVGLIDTVQKLQGRFPGQLMEFPKPSVQEKGAANDHPTVKPIALMAHLIRLFSKDGQIILDPFMGSGSTGVAARMTGRRFIGFEKNADYFEIAARRIDSAGV